MEVVQLRTSERTMSAFYRCDLCGLEVPHPGMDTEQECILLPDGWKSDGEERDFCPAHSLRIKEGSFVHFSLNPEEEYSAEEWGNVSDYIPSRRRYVVRVWVDEDEGLCDFLVPADHLEQENPSVYWVPRDEHN